MKKLALLLVLAACSATPPAPNIQRQGTEVNAPFDRTWNAVVQQFAEYNIPIRTMDRSSGYIATDNQLVSDRQANNTQYDCGKDGVRVPIEATGVVYNVLVTGDSTRSRVKVTARWASVQPAVRVQALSTSKEPVNVPCTTQGGWESLFEGAVKITAESGARRP